MGQKDLMMYAHLTILDFARMSSASASCSFAMVWYGILPNDCRERHLIHDSPLNFDLTLNACVTEDVARIATLDISNGGSYGFASRSMSSSLRVH